jgi:hypothetical protein
MSDRITIRHLRSLAAHLNKLTGSPDVYMDDQRRILVGHFHIDRAYGGNMLARTMNESGGINAPLGQAHIPARQLYDLMHAFIRGIEFERSSRA